MADQKVEQLITLHLDKKHSFWIHPFTGILLYSKNDSKITIHHEISLMDQIPPDYILEVPFGLIAAINFGSNIFAIGFETGEVALIENNSYHLKKIKKVIKKAIKFLSLSTNEKELIVYTDDDKLSLIDLEKEKIIKEYKVKDGIITGHIWISESRFVYVTSTGSIHYLDSNSGKTIKVITQAHNTRITCLTKHPRSMYSLVTSDSSGEIKIWDLNENKIYPDLINTFFDQKNEVTSLSCSPRGEFILAGDIKGNIRIFDTLRFRDEKLLLRLTIDQYIKNIIPSNEPGKFLALVLNQEHNTGSIMLFQGFSLESVTQEFDHFKNEIQAFTKKIEQIPEWVQTNTLDQLIPSEIPIIEKNLDLVSKILNEPIIDKINISGWLKSSFKDNFKKEIQLDVKLRENITNLKNLIEKQKDSIAKVTEQDKKLREDIIHYIKDLKPGRVSLDQISLYFNVPNEILIPLIQKLDQDKLVNASLKSEYTGYFVEINQIKSLDYTEQGQHSLLDQITCHNCGNDYPIDRKICPNCNSESITCESCLNYIQKRQMVINCPYCRSYFHLACFESKVKLFGRCPKCRETVDFDKLIRKSVDEQKHQDQIISGLNKLISKKASYHKQIEEKDADDDLFDF